MAVTGRAGVDVDTGRLSPVPIDAQLAPTITGHGSVSAVLAGTKLNVQPAPIVHGGVLYVNNTGNVLQALDANTGELIWENRYGTNAAAAAMRGITIYDDKIFLATNTAHLMAFDARNGKQVWDTAIGDRSKGEYSTTSGPLAVKGKLRHCQLGRKRDVCFVMVGLSWSRLRPLSLFARPRTIAIARVGDSSIVASGVLLEKDSGPHRGGRETVGLG
jgi:hypothetical protein